MGSDAFAEELEKQIAKLPVFDTHEHLPKESAVLREGLDPFRFVGHYLRADLVAAGMSVQDAYQTLQDTSVPLEERWKLLEPYWRRVKFGRYARAARIALRELFGVDDLSLETLHTIAESLRQEARPGYYRRILTERGNIRWVLNFVEPWLEDVEHPDPEFLLPVPTLFELVMLRRRADLEHLESRFNAGLETFDRYIGFLENVVSRYVHLGARALKFNLAYARTLRFGRPTRHEAEVAFNRLFSHYGEGAAQDDLVPLQDYLLRHLLTLATEHGLPVVFHTGYQNDQAHILEHARATHLASLFLDFPRTRFVLLHAGFPWVEETLLLSKMFVNVWQSLAWLYILSGELSARALRFCLDALPLNRVFAFGGDYMIVEKVLGHLHLARQMLAFVLAERVKAGELTE
ncbi:MAG: amidohydrolase family protein, partial [Calditrichaeota bacterium]|nr:amidohydrolase family protein [Calditrichota bacterium]